MDPLTYIRAALKPLKRKIYRRHHILISPDDVSIGWLSDGGESSFIELESALEIPALATKIPALLKKYGIDYPEFS